MIQGQKFDHVLHEVHTRAARALPDAVVALSELRMNEHGHLVGPGLTESRLNEYARRQLASLLGIRWSRWFEAATAGERAEEVTRRLGRMPGERKIRRMCDETGTAAGVVRALLAPAFTPIDDVRIFDRLAAAGAGLTSEYRFSRVDVTDATTHYAAVHAQPVVINADTLHPGWHLRNSEVGGGPLTLDDYWLRIVCTNGLMIPVAGKHLLYRTHRQVDDDQLTAMLVVALSRLPAHWIITQGLMAVAHAMTVERPDEEVAEALEGAAIPRELVTEAQTIALRDGPRTRFGVMQAITYVAHAVNQDPEIRYRLEAKAGEYLAAA
jgi:hypothetical protein